MCPCKKKGKSKKRKCSCGVKCKDVKCMNIFKKKTLKRRGKHKRKSKVKTTNKYAFLI